MSRYSRDRVRLEAYGKGHPGDQDCQSNVFPSRLYDERLPPEPAYPSILPSVADFHASEEHNDDDGPGHPAACEDLVHAPPGLSASPVCLVGQVANTIRSR